MDEPLELSLHGLGEMRVVHDGIHGDLGGELFVEVGGVDGGGLRGTKNERRRKRVSLDFKFVRPPSNTRREEKKRTIRTTAGLKGG